MTGYTFVEFAIIFSMNITRISVRGIIFREGKIFLQRNHGNDFWSLPGGKLENDESLTDCLIRELREEIDIEAKVGRLLFVQQFPNSAREHAETPDKSGDSLDFFFAIDNPDGFANVDWRAAKFANEIDDAGWFLLEQLHDMDVLPEFLKQLDADFITHGSAQYFDLRT